MGYFEINRKIAVEINAKTSDGKLRFAPSKATFTNDKHYSVTTVRPVGVFESEVVNRKLYVAHKKRRAPVPDVFARELAVIEGIATDFPHLTPHLPQFMTWLEGKNGEWNGYLMEDFSEGGRKKVVSIEEREAFKRLDMFPEELYEWIPDMYERELSHMCFFVGDEQTLKMGDFDTALSTMSEVEVEERFKVSEVKERIKEFTVFVANDIE